MDLRERRDSFFKVAARLLKCFIKILVINRSCNYIFPLTRLPSFEFENPETVGRGLNEVHL